MQRNVMLAEEFGAQVIVTSAAESIWDLRAGRELASLAYLNGMDIASAIKTVTETPQNIVSRIKKIKSPKFIGPGVEIK
jgi:RNase P/RNase MRP subunit p30